MTHCPEDRLAALLAGIGNPDAAAGLDALLHAWPNDARLHFLKGSLLAAAQDYPAARAAMRRAVDLAPDYAIARFQLGFLCLTSGDPHHAREVWGPLHGLPPENFLRLFVEALCHLIRDDFTQTIASLRAGIAANVENPAMNKDMELIVEECRRHLAGRNPAGAVDLLLRQSALKATRH